MPQNDSIEIGFGAEGETLDAYLYGRDRVTFIMGPLGSGKTIASCQRILMQMIEQAPNSAGVRPSRWYAIRNTYSDLQTTTIKDFAEVFDGICEIKKGGSEPPNAQVAFLLPDGTKVESEVVFLALDRPDSVKKLRGAQVTGFWLNETKELDKSTVDMADLRHGRYPTTAAGGVRPSWHGMIGDTNAPDDDHWYYKLAEETHPEGWVFLRQPGGVIKDGNDWVLNPLAENLSNLPDGYYIRGLQGKAEDWIKVNLANEYGYVQSGKPVHPQYVDSIHCAPDILKPMPGIKIKVGMDFGRTPAAALFQKLPNGRYIVIDEFVTHDVSAATFAPEFKRFCDEHYSQFEIDMPWGDPAGDGKGQGSDDTPFTVLRRHGINARPTETNSPLVRRAALVNPMLRNCMDGKPAFLLSPKCKMIRKGLAGGFCYKRVQVSGERYRDEPDKNEYSHPVEALEYGLQGDGEGRETLIGKPRYSKPVNINKGFNPLQR